MNREKKINNLSKYARYNRSVLLGKVMGLQEKNTSLVDCFCTIFFLFSYSLLGGLLWIGKILLLVIIIIVLVY